jgi:flagellar basal body-associated protein FliL
VNREIIIAVIAIVSASAIILPMVWRIALSLLSKLRGGDPKSSVESDKRSADAKPAIETVAYVRDIQAACGIAPADFVLQCLSSGMSRDEARAARIESLEGEGKGPTLKSSAWCA